MQNCNNVLFSLSIRSSIVVLHGQMMYKVELPDGKVTWTCSNRNYQHLWNGLFLNYQRAAVRQAYTYWQRTAASTTRTRI